MRGLKGGDYAHLGTCSHHPGQISIRCNDINMFRFLPGLTSESDPTQLGCHWLRITVISHWSAADFWAFVPSH